MIQPQIADFIEKNMANEVLRHLPAHDASERNAEILFSAKIFPQKSKEGVLTLKQKDSIFVISDGKSYLWGDVDLPEMNGVTVLTSENMKFRDLIAKYLIEEYDMKSKLLLIWQSKADKSDTFALSQGSIIKLCGNENWRIDVQFLKKSAPELKRLGVARADFYELCRLIQFIQFATDVKEHDKAAAKKDKLFKKYPKLDASVESGLIPLLDSPEMNIIGWYLE